MKKSRVIFDTNVIVSASLFTKSVPQLAFDKGLDTSKIIISTESINEIIAILQRPKFDKYTTLESRLKFLDDLLQAAEIISIQSTITLCRDPKDNQFLELAVDGQADYLITGDRDLLILNPFHQTEILTPAQFLEK